MLKFILKLFKTTIPCFEFTRIDNNKKLIISYEDTKSFVNKSKNKHKKVSYNEFGENFTPNTQLNH